MSKRILMIVDDEPDVRSILGEVLVDDFPDCEMLFAENGLDAWEKLNAALEERKEGLSPAMAPIVISDINMPKMTGFELFDKIRRAPIKCVFLFISGHFVNEKTFNETYEQSGGHFMLKPVNFDELVTSVKKLIVANL